VGFRRSDDWKRRLSRRLGRRATRLIRAAAAEKIIRRFLRLSGGMNNELAILAKPFKPAAMYAAELSMVRFSNASDSPQLRSCHLRHAPLGAVGR
jgi:hypothetical protein